MFESARIKLTAWYCLIIMAISLAFSLTIYQMMNVELQRFARNQRFRLERKVEFKLPPPPVIDPEVLAETQQRIIVVLLGVNGIILVFSATLGYFLAGRTLSPIKKMVEEQKRFIDDASHEIRTPLTALKTNLEVNLRDPNLKLNEAKKVITESVEETNKLILLSNYLLNLSRLDQNKIKLQLETIKFNQFKSLFSKNQR
ncbi:MAG TPA: histidine kinase dimerization/phospho-acceptor domain-containing protein, partial [Candidatus Woesebacteria bacterium]|nr:histidine kinase dimerization/phospho-acceptor domain-containing protein [Candidatus Woesebacteria bacterium]